MMRRVRTSPKQSRWLPFEEPLQELEEQIHALEEFTAERGIDRSAQVAALRERQRTLTQRIFSSLSPWDQVLLARHPSRPYTLDYLRLIFDDWVELHGDRRFGDDPALVAGFARLNGKPVAVVGHQKGRDTRERVFRNFGSARPEGYRKALRVMRLAAKFGRPIIALVDTPAAESRLEAEERGIAESIAYNMAEMSALPTPIVVAIIGEGGSGGAIGIAVGDWIAMQEHSIYSVIPPEGCAAILDTFGRDASRGPDAAAALKVNAESVLALGVVDEVVPEPLGGAHRDPPAAATALKEALARSLGKLKRLSTKTLLERRYEKFRRIGQFIEPPSVGADS